MKHQSVMTQIKFDRNLVIITQLFNTLEFQRTFSPSMLHIYGHISILVCVVVHAASSIRSCDSASIQTTDMQDNRNDFLSAVSQAAVVYFEGRAIVTATFEGIDL